MNAPRISIVIPTRDRPAELRLCLEGFSRQTANPDTFELVIVDDGSSVDLVPVVAEFAGCVRIELIKIEHGGISVARNAALARARAPFLILYDDDQRPFATLVDYCIDFHHRNAAVGETALLPFRLDPMFDGDPAAAWVFDRMVSFPATPGWQTQPSSWFWGGAITCKRDIFEGCLFDPGYKWVEDFEIARRLARRLPLRVFYESADTGTMIRRVTIPQFLKRQFLLSYYRCMLARAHPQFQFGCGPYDRPADYVMEPGRLAPMLSSARALERSARSTQRSLELVRTIWTRAELHAMASGWGAALEGRPPVFEEVS